MGLTHVSAEVIGANGVHKKLLFLVDSGASYSLLPLEIWKDLELKPMREVVAVLADGTKLTRSVSECRICLDEVSGTTPVLLGERDDELLLGAITLENLGLILDPYKRRLQAMHVRL